MKSLGLNRPVSAISRIGFSLMGLLFAAGVSAQNILEDISYQAGSGGKVDVVMDLAEPMGEPRIFTTTDPARIAIDFGDTKNAISQRTIAVGSGATRSVSAVEANDTTRVVIDLFRMSEYETRIEGDKFIVSIGGAGGVTSAIASANRGSMSKSSMDSDMSVENIDFRRGPNGEGRVIISFSSENANVDLREDGGNILINLYDVNLPERLERRLDVMDFATPVRMIEAANQGDNVRMVIEADENVEKLAYQAGNEYVIEIGEEQVTEEEEIRDALEPPTYDGSRVTFNFQDIPVRSVLQLIADVSGLNIVVADSVDGNVTLRLQNVPWDQALDIILNAKALDKRENGNVVWIAPAEEIAARERQQLQALQEKKTLAPLRSTIMQINYANASELKTLIEDEGTGTGGGGGGQGDNIERTRGLLSMRGSVTVHEPTNTLLLTDTSERTEQIRALIQELDRPIRQVQIEARVVIATEDFRKDLGVRFGVTSSHQDGNGNVLSTAGSLGALDAMNNAALNNRFVRGGQGGSLPTIVPGALPLGVAVPNLADRLNVNLPVASQNASGFGFSVLAADYLLDLELSALESEGRGEIVSSPRVIAANQQEAFIKQGTEIAFQSVTGVGANATPQVEFKEVVLELRVVPLITPDDRIVLDLLVKKDEPRFDLITGGEPAIDKREVQTNVLVDNGQTVVLGGVYEYSKRDAEAGVPFLSDIPGLGALFRQTLKDREKAELLIFVTPTILDDRVGFK